MQSINMNNSLKSVRIKDVVIQNICKTEDIEDILFIHSIFFDFLTGIISSVCLRQFYRGIETSHPMYAILFSNILFSTAISFLTFILIFLAFIEAIPCVVALSINDIIHFMPIMACIITWPAIATLRYYLLANRENDGIDLPKLTRISLTCTWVTFTIIMSIRITFMVLINFGFNIFPVNAIFIVFCLIMFSGLFFVVSYQTDRMLNEKRENLSSERKRSFANDDDADTVKSVVELPGVRKRNRTTQIQQADSTSISVEGTDNHDSKNTVTNNSHDFTPKPELDIDPNPSFEYKCITNDYGGVYIGDDGLDVSLPNQICITAAIHESRVVPLLPINDDENQIFSESIIENSCLDLRTRGSEESGVDHTTSKNIEEDSNRIEVVDEFPTSNSMKSQNSKYCHDFLDESLNGDDCSSMLQILYRDSKEHKSIMKTVIFNAICLCFIMVCYFVVMFFSYYENIYVVTIFSDFIKFQRTFQTLIASIYCFEVVNQLFKETMVNLKNMLTEWATRIREAL